MTYDASEKLRYAGKPLECFKFSQGATTWLWTSDGRTVTLPAGTFLPEVISRGPYEFSGEEDSEVMEIHVARTNPVAALFLPFLPEVEIGVTVYAAHRGSESEAIGFFSGKALACREEGGENVITCSSAKQQLRRMTPPLRFQTHCNHVLYSPGCGANPNTSADIVVIGTVSGRTVVASEFALRANGWFNGGRIVTPSGATRAIANHVGNTITLLGAIQDLAPLDICTAYWGCNHLESDCGPAKFNVLANKMGWEKIPSANPTVDGV